MAAGDPTRKSQTSIKPDVSFFRGRDLWGFPKPPDANGMTIVHGRAVPQSIGQLELVVTDKPDQLSQNIDDRLAEIIGQISDARDAFGGIAQHASRTIEVKLEQVRTRAAARCAQFQKERERVNSKVKRALANAKQNLDAWKNSGQSERLRRYADQAEQYALAAILDANEAIDGALIAAMESLTARLIAERAVRKS